MRQRSPFVRLAPLLAVLLGSGCAHGGFERPDDPVEEARLRLSALGATPDGALCAAERVDRGWALDALRASGPEEASRMAYAREEWRRTRAREANLSQASAAAAAAWDAKKVADAAQRAGDPDARLRSYRAMRAFDAWAGAAESRGVLGVRPGAASPSDEAWAAAEYASVWTEYFDTGDVETRNRLLDWLTTRSMDNRDLLRAYHDAFAAARRNACGAVTGR